MLWGTGGDEGKGGTVAPDAEVVSSNTYMPNKPDTGILHAVLIVCLFVLWMGDCTGQCRYPKQEDQRAHRTACSRQGHR